MDKKSGISSALPKANMSLADLRTPILENFLSMLPTGHEKALKNALYNVFAFVLSVFAMLAFWTVYCILEPFLRPLLWALLVGSVLHPFKANLSEWTRSWLRNVRKSSTPFAVHVMLTPLNVVDTLSDRIGKYVWTYWKSIAGGLGLFFVTYFLYYNPPVRVTYFFQWIILGSLSLIHGLLEWINWQIIISINLVYVGYIFNFVWWRQLSGNDSSSKSRPTVENLDATITRESGDILDESCTDNPPETTEISDGNYAKSPPLNSWIRSLSYITWIFTFLFIILRLPYAIIIPIALFVVAGVGSYVRGQRDGTSLSIPQISRAAYQIVLNIGSTQRSTEFGVCNNSLILSPRRSLGNIKIPSPSATLSDSPLNSTKCPGAESTLTEDKRLQRAFSDTGCHTPGTPRPQSISKIETEETPKSMPSPIYDDTETLKDEENHLIDSNTFLYGVLCACLVVHIWNRLWLLHLLPIPVVYYGTKKLFCRFGIGDYCGRHSWQPFLRFYQDLKNPHSNQIFPAPIRLAIKILVEADKRIVSICETYLDPVVSLVVLIIVVIGTISGVIFAAVQIYGEGDHLVRVTVNLANTTVSQYPEINNVLPEGWHGILDSMVGNAYLYGKEYITNMVRDSVAEKNPEKAEQIEKQVIELFDRIYLSYNQTWENSILQNTANFDDGKGQGIEWDELLQTGREMPRLLEISALTNYAKANVGTIWTITESCWNIFVGNISMVLSAVTAIASLLFGGGTAILNWVLNLVVFFTALFYLLSSPSSTYFPVELFHRYTPGSGRHSKNFAKAVEEAINGVFTASFKMSAFYGLWTWLIHTLFQVNIVFIPSIFGAVFGAVPILGPYWAAFPAVLEIWLIQGHWVKAILMICAQMAPMSVVDTQIYREIKGGGHPYLTGLAVAGGIFYFGFQGAIIGPLVLCCFFVAVKIGNSFLREETENETSNLLSRSLYRSDTNMTPPKQFASSTSE